MRPCLVSNDSRTVLIPSLCEMLVYYDFMPMVAMIVLGSDGVSRLKMVCKKLFVSLMWDGTVRNCTAV